MKLNVLERILALGILPEAGNFATLKIVNDLKFNLSLTEAEYKEFGVQTKGDQMTWNTKGAEEREIKMGEKATDILIEALKKLDKEETLTNQQVSLYEKFIG